MTTELNKVEARQADRRKMNIVVLGWSLGLALRIAGGISVPAGRSALRHKRVQGGLTTLMGLTREDPRPTCEGEGGMRRSAGSLRPLRQAATVGRAVANTLEEAARASDMPLREHPKAVRKRRLSNTVPRIAEIFLACLHWEAK